MSQAIEKLKSYVNLESRKNVANLITVLLAFITILVLTIIIPAFLTVNNIINVLQQLTTVGFLALGITFVLIVGGIDLSMPSVLMASATTGAVYMVNGGGSVFIGILIMLGIGLAFGLINGLAVSKARMVPFIVTLSTMVIAKGWAVFITNKVSIFGLPDGFLVFGTELGIIPISIPIFFFFVILTHVFLKRTRFGRIFYMIGISEETAKVSGIRTSRFTLSAYLISGVMAAICGLLFVARTNMAGSTIVGDTMIMDTVSAAVIGGASLNGGKGSVFGSVLGALFIVAISNFINLMGISSYAGMVIKGVLILLVIGLDILRSEE